MKTGKRALKALLTPLALALAYVLTACQPVCPPGSVRYVALPQAVLETEASDQEAPASPQEIEIRAFLGTKIISVDQVIEGFLCDDTWSGTVYVTCNVEIPAWETDAFFFQECKPTIDPDTVVYVAAHDDKPYSEGCTCHE